MENDRITFRIPSSLFVEIDKEMEEKRVSMSDIIREALLDHFSGKKKNEVVADALKCIRGILQV